ncbi:MAG: hypothetical protein JWR67_83 [Mucilaginibacter sp.]|nr:hypothetical protein [Mucilaginibacter sp.]
MINKIYPPHFVIVSIAKDLLRHDIIRLPILCRRFFAMLRTTGYFK